MAQLLTPPKIQFKDNNGNALSGGSLYSYAAGTTTPLATYTDQTESTPATNPIVLDTNGMASVWIGSSAYKFVLKDSLGVTIWTADNISTVNALLISTGMLANLAVTTAKIADANVTTAKLQDGSVTTAKIADSNVTTAKILDSNVTTSKILDSNVTTAKLADHAVTLAKMDTSTVQNFPLGKNKIINGSFAYQLRGIGSALSSGNFILDRWIYLKNGTMVNTSQRRTTVPSVALAGQVIPFSLQVNCSTAQTSLAAGDYAMVGQKIEGDQFRPIAQRSFTLSFYSYSSKTGVYCVSFRNSGFDKSYVAEYTVTTANTWEKQSITVTASPSSGTWSYSEAGVGLIVGFTLAAGTTYQTTAGAWQSGNFLSTANQVNAVDSTSNILYIAAPQLEDGTVATRFEDRPITIEQALCARFYEFIPFEFHGYNTNVAATGAMGGLLSYRWAKPSTPTSSLPAPIYTLAGSGSISATSINSVTVTANFVSGAAGTASFSGTVIVDAEI